MSISLGIAKEKAASMLEDGSDWENQQALTLATIAQAEAMESIAASLEDIVIGLKRNGTI